MDELKRHHVLDAWALDWLIVGELQSRLTSLITTGGSPTWIHNNKSVVGAIIAAVAIAVPLFIHGQTPGQFSLDIAPRGTRVQHILFLVLIIIARYSFEVMHDDTSSDTDRRRSRWFILRAAAAAWGIGDLVCLLMFLRRASARATLAEELTGTTMVDASHDSALNPRWSIPSLSSADCEAVSRQPPVAYSLIATHMLFAGLSSFATFVRGYTDWHARARDVGRAARRSARYVASLVYTREAAAAGQSLAASQPCAWCGISPATHASRAACGHTYCYVCLMAAVPPGTAASPRSALALGREMQFCPACDEPVDLPPQVATQPA